MAVKIFGHEVSTPAAVAIGGGSLVAVWFAYKQHKSSSTSASAIDPVTGLPTSQDQQVDPLTGSTYLAEAQQYGSVSAAENAVAGESSLGYSSSYGSGGGLVGTSTDASLVPANVVQGTTYASNAAWAQAVEAGLTDIGYAPTDISAALGRYLANLSETPAQATIVQAGIAEYGPPPVGSYQVIMASTTPTVTPGSTGTGGPITAVPVGLHTTQVSATSVGVAWSAPTIPSGQGPLTGYTAEVYTAAGKSEGPPWTVPATQTEANAGGLKPKTAYHLNVWCEPAKTGGPHASVSFTTK